MATKHSPLAQRTKLPSDRNYQKGEGLTDTIK